MRAEQIGRVLNALLEHETQTQTHESRPVTVARSPIAARYCIIRCRDAGVHAGIVQWHEDRTAYVTEARRLWRWRVPMGAPAFLSGVASHGLDTSDSKIGAPIEILLCDVCEIMPCSDAAARSIREAPIEERTK